MDPALDPDASALSIYEPIFSTNSYGQPPWEALFPANDVLHYVQYEAHCLLGTRAAMTVQLTITSIVVILGSLSFMLEGCAKKPDPDEVEIRKFQQAGLNLTKPHTINFYLHFPSRSAAEQAATHIRQNGFQAEVNRRMVAREEEWLCLGKKAFIPEWATLRGIRRDLEALASSLHGDYAGWEPVVGK